MVELSLDLPVLLTIHHTMPTQLPMMFLLFKLQLPWSWILMLELSQWDQPALVVVLVLKFPDGEVSSQQEELHQINCKSWLSQHLPMLIVEPDIQQQMLLLSLITKSVHSLVLDKEFAKETAVVHCGPVVFKSV